MKKTMKRVLCLALALVLLGGIGVSAYAGGLFDAILGRDPVNDTEETAIRATRLSQTSSGFDIGIDARNVRLAWELEGSARGTYQSAYRLVVRNDETTVYDTDWVTSSAQTGIPVGNLAPETVYYWSVNVKDQYGNESGFSKEASFETAPAEALGEWIGLAALLRTEFTLEQPLENIARARSYIGAPSPIEIHLNGQKVGDLILAPMKSVADVEVFYNTYDILPYLQEGRNAVGIMCSNLSQYPMGERAAGMLRIYYKDGSVQTVATDEAWLKTKASMITRGDWFRGEDINGNAMIGWDTVGYDTSAWTAAENVGSKVRNGKLYLAAGDNIVTALPVVSGDYTVEADVQITQGSYASIVFGRADGNPHMWQFDAANATLRIHPSGSWAGSTIKTVPCAGIKASGVFRVKLEVVGTEVKTYVEGTLVNVFTVTESSKEGRIGFRAATKEGMAVDALRVTRADGTLLYEDTFDRLDPSLWNLVAPGKLTPALTGARIVDEIAPVNIYEITSGGVDTTDAYIEDGCLVFPAWKTYYSQKSFSGDYSVSMRVRSDNTFGFLFGNGSPYGAMWQFTGSTLKAHLPGNWGTIKSCTVSGMNMTEMTDIRIDVVGNAVTTTVNGVSAGTIELEAGTTAGPIGFRTATGESFHLDSITVTQNGETLLSDAFDTLDSTKWTFPKKLRTYVVDFGVNVAGYVRVSAKLDKNDTVKLAYSELVDETGKIFANTTCHYPTCTYTFTGGEDVFEPHFFYNGFQYVEVTAPVLTAEMLTACVIANDVEETGAFESSSERLNAVLDLYYRAQLSNLVNVYTDCPQREKQGWTGDAFVTKNAAGIIFEDYTVAEAYMRLMTENVMASGMPNVILPQLSTDESRAKYFDIPWATAYFVFPYQTYLQTGDTYYIEMMYDTVLEVFDYYKSIAGEDGVPTKVIWGDWMGYDGHENKNNNEALAAVFAYHSGMLVSEMAEIIGRDHSAIDADLQRIYDAMQERFHAGTYFGADTQANNATAIHFGLISPEERDAFIAQLISNINAYGSLRTGVLGTYSLYNVLSAENEHKLLMDLTLNEEKCSFGYMLDNGATSMWEFWDKVGETWDSEKKNCTYDSQNHCMLGGSMAAWLYEGIAGVRATGAGYAEITYRPGLESELAWAKCSVDTVRGVAASDWKYENGVLDWTVTVPANADAIIVIPMEDAASITESGADVLGKNGDGLTYLGIEDGAHVWRAGSGTYTFTATEK